LRLIHLAYLSNLFTQSVPMSDDATNEKRKLFDSIIKQFFHNLVDYLNTEKLYDEYEHVLDDICSSVRKFKAGPNYPNLFSLNYYYSYKQPDDIKKLINPFVDIVYHFVSNYSKNLGIQNIDHVSDTILFDNFFCNDVINYVLHHEKYIFCVRNTDYYNPFCSKCLATMDRCVPQRFGNPNQYKPNAECECPTQPHSSVNGQKKENVWSVEMGNTSIWFHIQNVGRKNK